jgi:transcriptional regulator with XRE-family HTH domain
MAEFRHLGAYLKQKRIEAGYTQAELASSLGDVHSQFVSNWERSLCAPPGHSLQKLIDLLKLNRDKLVDVMLMDSRAEIEARVYKKKAKAGRKAS